MVDLASMTVEEIEGYKLDLRKQRDAIREQMREAEIVRAAKINSVLLAAKVGQDVSNLTPAEVKTLLAIANKPKPGDVVAEIGTAVLTAKGQGGDDDA